MSAAEPPQADPARPPGLLATVAVAATAAGLVLHALAVLRVHALLSGVDPAPGHLAAAAVTFGLWAGASWRVRRGPSAFPARLAALAAAVAALALVLLAPVPLARLAGWPAAAITFALVAVPAVLVGRALSPGAVLGRGALLAAGLAAVVGSMFLLPHAGPAITGALAALLLLAAAADGGRDVARGVVASPIEHGPAAMGVTLVAVGVTWLAAIERPWPWPLAGAAAGVFLIGVAAGRALRPRSATFGLALAALLLAVSMVLFRGAALHPELALLDAVVGNQVWPTVGTAGGAIAILCGALLHGLLPGLAAGLALPSRWAARADLLRWAAMAGAVLAAAAAVAALPGLVLAEAVFGAGAFMLVVTRGAALRASGADVRLPLAAIAILLGAVVLVGKRPRDIPGLAVVAERRAPAQLVVTARTTRAGEPESDQDRLVLEEGALVATTARSHVYDEALAGHLAALIPSPCERVLVVGAGAGAALEALRLHGVDEVVVREPSRLLRAASLAPVEGAGIAPAPSVLPSSGGKFDALIWLVEDPTRPVFAPWFTSEAYEIAREMLRPGGVLVHRLSLDRLGPEDLLRRVEVAREDFPHAMLATADNGRGGTVLLVAPATAPDETFGLPHARLSLDPRLNPAMTPQVVEHLGQVALLQPDDLLATFVAGPRELAAANEAGRWTPWAEGGDALRLPAPELAARQLARALLYSRIATVDVPLALVPDQGGDAAGWSLLGIETTLGPEWTVGAAGIRYLNRYVRVLDEWGVYRDASARIVFERPGASLTVSEQVRARAGVQTLAASIRGATTQPIERSGVTAVNGHDALWTFAQPALDRQEAHVTWHCVVQERLYVASYQLSDGKPGMPEPAVELVASHVRCRHPPR